MRANIFMGKFTSETLQDEVSKRAGIFEMLWNELSRKTTKRNLPKSTYNLEFVTLQAASAQLNFLRNETRQLFDELPPDSGQEIDQDTDAFLKLLLTQLDEHLDTVMSRFGFDYDH